LNKKLVIIFSFRNKRRSSEVRWNQC